MRDYLREPVTESITIAAPLERLFALSTRVELVRDTLGMELVEGPGTLARGAVVAGSRVHWRGWKFGLPTEHHTLITALDPPHRQPTGELTAFFQDAQERGRFAFFQHDHHFREAYDSEDPATQRPHTTLHDEVRFALPFGPLGRLAARWLLAPYIARLCRRRFAVLKALAEGEGWREWVSA